MRWTLGNYTLKYNPSTVSKTWNPLTDVNINANGQISNPNLTFNGTQSFTIDIYDEPTNQTSSPISGSYIGVSEKRINERMYLLKSGGIFDVKGKDGTLYETHTVATGNGITLPTTKPTSIIHFDTGLAFMYKEATQSSLLITDENGVSNRKYIYSSDDLKYAEDVAWDYNSSFIALNPYGKIYTINTSTGTETFLYQFDDYSTNFSNSFKRYTDIIMYQKNNNLYIGVLRDSKDVIFIDYVSLNIVCKSETGLGNILSISYSNYSGDSFCVFSSKVMQTSLNTCRIDIEILKSIVANVQVQISDEQGFPYVLAIKTMSANRIYNKNEARYQVTIEGDIVYTNIGFGNTWTTNTRNF